MKNRWRMQSQSTGPWCGERHEAARSRADWTTQLAIVERRGVLLLIQRALELDDAGANFLEAWVEAESASESFKRGDGVVLQQVALSHSRRRGEVIWIDFKCLVAIANRRLVLAEVIVGGAALAPG